MLGAIVRLEVPHSCDTRANQKHIIPTGQKHSYLKEHFGGIIHCPNQSCSVMCVVHMLWVPKSQIINSVSYFGLLHYVATLTLGLALTKPAGSAAYDMTLFSFASINICKSPGQCAGQEQRISHACTNLSSSISLSLQAYYNLTVRVPNPPASPSLQHK